MMRTTKAGEESRKGKTSYLAITIDRPSDTIGFTNAQFDQYRVSPSHAHDIIAVLSEVDSLYGTGTLELFLAGTSRGALSIVAQNMLGIGSMLSAPVTSQSGQNLWIGTDSPEPRLLPGFVTVPVQVLTHKDDACFVSTPENSKKLHKDFAGAGVKSDFEKVNGGFEVNPDPCQATTFHGFLGIENKAVKKTIHRMDQILKRHNGRHRRNAKPTAENATVTTVTTLAVDIDFSRARVGSRWRRAEFLTSPWDVEPGRHIGNRLFRGDLCSALWREPYRRRFCLSGV